MWEAVADSIGDADALMSGGVTTSWSEFDERAGRLAAYFSSVGVGRDAKVAHYLYNCPEYIETTFAAFKARAIPVNVNYRYTRTELAQLLENSDAEIIVADADLLPHVVDLLHDLEKVRAVVMVGPGECPDGVVRYEDAVAAFDPAPRIDRSPDDLWFLYTGGTTGMPKGVMWPHRSLFGTAAPTYKAVGHALPDTPAAAAAIARAVHDAGEGIRLLPAAPLMHGTSAISSWGALDVGGSVVTLTSRSFDAAELLAAVQRSRVTNLTIVGDAFAVPLLDEIRAAERRGNPYDMSSLRLIVSSGVMWSAETKAALLERVEVALADLLGSSEGVGFANSVTTRNRAPGTGTFRLGPSAAVFTEDGRAVEPGSDERGLLAVGGPIPIGYYKDPAKTADTFRTFGGRVWSVPGDWATVESDGTIVLLGRGSMCINTAGEKVFPEEVEERLKQHPGVVDANVVGVPDEKWGSAVVAVVSLTADGAEVSDAELTAHCRETLAGYKCPKTIVRTDHVERAANGKADYSWATRMVQRDRAS